MNPEVRKFFDEHRGSRPIEYKACTTSREVLRESQLPYLPIVGFAPPIAAMYEEAKKLIPRMIAHRSDYEDNVGWKSLVLHGLAHDKTENADKYGLDPEDAGIYKWTEIAELAPVTTDFFKNHFKYKHYHRIRFMLLEPGGYICPHQDIDRYVLGPINIALNNPKGCDFVMHGKGTLPFQAGTIMKLALVNHHAVYNASNEPRIHMIVHGAPDSQHWEKIIWNSYQQAIQSPDLRQL